MSVVPSPETRAALIARVKAILLTPKEEWPKIAAEPATIGGLYSSYVIYLAAIPLLCTLIGSLVFGYGVGGITYRPSLFGALTIAIFEYGFQLGGVYVLARIVDALTPRFGGNPDRMSAFKLAAYRRPPAGSPASSRSCPSCPSSLCSAFTAFICFIPAFPSSCGCRLAARCPSPARSSPSALSSAW